MDIHSDIIHNSEKYEYPLSIHNQINSEKTFIQIKKIISSFYFSWFKIKICLCYKKVSPIYKNNEFFIEINGLI